MKKQKHFFLLAAFAGLFESALARVLMVAASVLAVVPASAQTVATTFAANFNAPDVQALITTVGIYGGVLVSLALAVKGIKWLLSVIV